MSDNQLQEKQILIRAIHSPYFAKHVLAKNVPVLITTPALREIANTVVRHYGVSDDLLTLNNLNIKLERRLRLKAKKSKTELTEPILDSMFNLTANMVNAKEDNSESLLKDLESYIHTKLGNQVILEEATKGEDNISERVEKHLSEINQIKLTGTKYEPLDILTDLDRKATIYSQFGSKKIASGLKPLDILTGGGLEIGQIGLIAGSAGGGKTSFLTNLSYYYAMVAKRNVLHISLEELDTDQVLRFDRIITNTGLKEVFNPDGTIQDSYIQRVKHYYEAVNKNDSHGQIFFEKSTPLTLNVDDIRQMINTVEREKQTKIEVIILDYADLLKKSDYSDSEAQAGELLFQDLVKLAQETETLIFTGTQLNRGSGIADVKTMDNIEGSYRKKNTIAFGATLNSNSDERKKGYIRLYLDKVRNNFGFDDDFLYLRYDKKSMRLHAETPSEQEEHKSLVDANHTDNKPKISKNDSLENVINNALNN